MVEAVFEVLALGFERVVILVLDLPTSSASSGNCHDIVVSDGTLPAHCGTARRPRYPWDEFAPIDHQCLIAVAQGHLIDVTVGIGERLFAYLTSTYNGWHTAVLVVSHGKTNG
jgi:hypothetical protein